MTGHVTSGEGVVMASKARSGNSSSQFSRNFILTVLSFLLGCGTTLKLSKMKELEKNTQLLFYKTRIPTQIKRKRKAEKSNDK